MNIMLVASRLYSVLLKKKKVCIIKYDKKDGLRHIIVFDVDLLYYKRKSYKDGA